MNFINRHVPAYIVLIVKCADGPQHFNGPVNIKKLAQPICENGKKIIRKNARLIALVTERIILKRYALQNESIMPNILNIERNDVPQNENGAKLIRNSNKPITGNIVSKIMKLSQLVFLDGVLKI